MKREVPLLITLLFGMFLILDNFVGAQEAGVVARYWHLLAENIKTWVLIVAAFTFILGIGNIARIHWGKVSQRQAGWGYSVVTLAGMVVMILFGMILWIPFHGANGQPVPAAWSLFGMESNRSLFDWVYQAIYVPMQSTMFGLLAFFISSAAFRAFRVRSLQASLLALTAIVVILWRVPVGESLWAGGPDFVEFVMSCLQTAGKRAILIGAALGAISTGLRMILGVERTYLSGE